MKISTKEQRKSFMNLEKKTSSLNLCIIHIDVTIFSSHIYRKTNTICTQHDLQAMQKIKIYNRVDDVDVGVVYSWGATWRWGEVQTDLDEKVQTIEKGLVCIVHLNSNNNNDSNFNYQAQIILEIIIILLKEIIILKCLIYHSYGFTKLYLL